MLMGRDGFAGVEVTASVGGTYLGADRFEPFWAAAEELDALVFVHPTTRGFPVGVFEEHYLWNLVGNPIETTIAAAHIVTSQTLDPPSAAAGPARSRGRRDRRAGRPDSPRPTTVAAAGPPSARPADAVIRRFLFDTVTHDPGLLRALVDSVSAPTAFCSAPTTRSTWAIADPVRTVLAAGLPAEAERAVLSGNAIRELAPRADGDRAWLTRAYRTAIRHWAGRFIANGIEYDDFVATTAAIRALGRVAAPPGPRRRGSHRARRCGPTGGPGAAHRRRGVPAGGGQPATSPSSSGCSMPERNRRNTEAAVAACTPPTSASIATAERVEAMLDGGTVVANLRRPAGPSAGASRSWC